MGLFRRKTEVIDAESLMSEVPAAAISGDFRLTVQDVFSIRGRGTVVTGQVQSGLISVGAEVQQTRIGARVRTVRVSGIEMFRKVKEQAAAGERVGLLLDGIDHDDIVTGDVLIANGASTSVQLES
jgi:elongation factor Tu